MARLIAIAELIEVGPQFANEGGYLSCDHPTCENDIGPTMQVIIVDRGFDGIRLYCDEPEHRDGLD